MSNGIRVENYRSVESLLPIFELLELSSNVGAKEEAVGILAQICTDKKCRDAIRQSGGVDSIVEVLRRGAKENKMLISRAVRVVRLIASDSTATRKALRQAGATECLTPLIAYGGASTISVDAVAAVGYLAHHDPQTKGVVRKLGGVSLLVRMLHSDPENPVVCYAAAALHNLIDGSSRCKNAVRAAGAIPRLVQLLELEDFHDPVVEVVVRTLQKLAENSEEAQGEICQTGGLARLVELQHKTIRPSLKIWIAKTLQTLNLSRKERDDSKVLLSLGTRFQKEFEKLRHGSEQISIQVSEIHGALKTTLADSNKQRLSLEAENEDLRGILANKDIEINNLQTWMDERAAEHDASQKVVEEKSGIIHELKGKLKEQGNAVKSFAETLSQRDDLIEKLKENEQEKAAESKQLNILMEQSRRQIESLEGVISEKEKHLNAALRVEREESDAAKEQRNAAVLELVHMLRDVVTSSRPGSPTVPKHQEIADISESIQSLMQRAPSYPTDQQRQAPISHHPSNRHHSLKTTLPSTIKSQSRLKPRPLPHEARPSRRVTFS